MNTRKHGWRALSLAALLILGVAACRTSDSLLTNPSFQVIVNDEVPVPRSGTYDFDTKLFKLNYSEGDVDLAVIDDRITRVLEKELKKKGFRRVDERPDVIVSYAVAVDAPLSGSDLNSAYADGQDIQFPEPVDHGGMNYHQGALILDFVSASSRQHLWRGAIMAEIRMNVTEREKDQRVRNGVRALLEYFPHPVEK